MSSQRPLMQNQVPHELKEIDDGILTILAEGRNVPSNLADRLDKSRQWITQRLQQMESADYVRNVGRGVYELQAENVPADDLDRLGINHPTIEIDVAEAAELAQLLRDLDADLKAEFNTGSPEARDWAERLEGEVDDGDN